MHILFEGFMKLLYEPRASYEVSYGVWKDCRTNAIVVKSIWQRSGRTRDVIVYDGAKGYKIGKLKDLDIT